MFSNQIFDIYIYIYIYIYTEFDIKWLTMVDMP